MLCTQVLLQCRRMLGSTCLAGLYLLPPWLSTAPPAWRSRLQKVAQPAGRYFAGMKHVLAPVQHSLPHIPGEANFLQGAQCGRALRDVTAVTRQEGLTETEMVTPFGKLTSSATMRWRASGVSGAAEE